MKKFIILSSEMLPLEWNESQGQLYGIGTINAKNDHLTSIKTYTIDEVNIHIENSKIFRIRKGWTILPYHILEVL